MFGKRRRAASNPPQRAPPSASASLAATKAFIKDRESNGNLSSAAAAAALRTHVTTPTPVGDTITKRMVRRNSASSTGSNSRPPPGPLRRLSSSGSMTERSFRAPSPGRGSPADPNAPPVPPVPQTLQQQGSVVHRRASSLEPAYRVASPGPRGGGRGVSLDRGANPTGRGQRAASHLAQVSEEEDAVARSVNFSRPMSPGASPTQQGAAQQASHGWFGGPVVDQEAVQRLAPTPRSNTGGGSVSSYQLHGAQQSVQNAAQRPVRTHQVARGVEGSRLSSGSMRAKPTGSAVQSQSFLPPATKQAPRVVNPNSPDAIYDPSTRTFIHKQDAMARHRELHQEPEQPTQQYVAQHVDDYSPQHASRRTPSPHRQYVQQPVSPTPQRREEVLPRLDISTTRSAPAPHVAAPIQPLERANTSRKLDDTVHHSEASRTEDVSSTRFESNQDSSYPRLATPTLPTPTTPVTGQSRDTVRAGHDRTASLSPPRNAHFASVAVELAGVRHQPPPRSISPAKSALKPSPSVSRRGSSPVAPNGRFLSQGASSEASDTTSDGGTRKQKRNMRVSFDETPVIAGTAAQADAVSPTVPTGLSASKWSPINEKDNEFEDFMKPRPALPLFGSIRDKERRSPQEDVAEKVTETVSTPMSASVGSIGGTSQASSDIALGTIVAHDYAQRQRRTNDPLPPEVTTVEGSGYVSDSSDESSTQKHGELRETLQQPPPPEPKSLTTPLDKKATTTEAASDRIVEVPQIALLPATPSPYERPEPKFQSMMIPGGWDEEIADHQEAQSTSAGKVPSHLPPAPTIHFVPQERPVHVEEEDSADDNSSVYSDAYEDLSDGEGGFGSIDALMGSPGASSSSGLMFSRYADKSATDGPSSGLRSEIPADDNADLDATPTQDWNAARQHWSGVNASRKSPPVNEASNERISHAEAVIARVMQAPVTREEPKPARLDVAEPAPKISTTGPTSQPTSKPLKSALKKAPTPQPAPQVEPQIRKTMRGPPQREVPSSETHMKKTMRSGAGAPTRAEPQMRSSMRGGPDTASGGQPHMRHSMRTAESTPFTNTGLAASRHSMIHVDTKPPRGALQKRHIPAAAPAPKARPQSLPPIKQAAAPVIKYDSDSDASVSSFQRTRARGGRNQVGRHTMRGSMRQGSAPAPTMRAPAPAVSQVRSISPPSPALRKSLRPSSPTPAPVKSSKFSIRSLSPMGRFRSSKVSDIGPPSPTQPKKTPALSKQLKPTKQPMQKAPAVERAKAPFASRFADSSDEDDDDQPRRFQSRFADSDDDDEPIDYTLPPGLAPVRGIPRKAGEEDGDSTDLEEEADEKPTKTGPASSSATNGFTNGHASASANAQGAVLSAGSLRDSKHAPSLPSFEAGSKAKAKRGFFGLGKKKTTAAPSEPNHSATALVTTGSVVTTPTASEEIPLPPAQRNRVHGAPLTPIDEDKDFGDSVQASPQSRKAPKLQRRSTPEWPLPRVPSIPIDERPVSSDGIAPRRPRFQNRQSSAMSNVTAPVVDAQGRSVSYGRTGKKKKFQGLRRAFGLND